MPGRLDMLPLPTLLNEESFADCGSRSAFVAALKKMLQAVQALCQYGFAPQLGCSRTIMKRVCYDDVTFEAWLRLTDCGSMDEAKVRRDVLVMISKVPRLEDGYAPIGEDPEFDVLWNGRQIYANAEFTVPAFVISIGFNLPVVSLSAGIFAAQDIVFPVKCELDDKGGIVEEQMKVYSFADVVQVHSRDGELRGIIDHAIVSEDDFRCVRSTMFPDFSFSDEVEEALSRHRIAFRRIDVLRTLMDLHKAFVRMIATGIPFEDAYGHLASLAMDESNATKQMYPGTRTFRWNGVRRDCYPHVKLGNKIRIHFFPSKSDGILYVGYIGPHLPRAGEG